MKSFYAVHATLLAAAFLVAVPAASAVGPLVALPAGLRATAASESELPECDGVTVLAFEVSGRWIRPAGETTELWEEVNNLPGLQIGACSLADGSEWVADVYTATLPVSMDPAFDAACTAIGWCL